MENVSTEEVKAEATPNDKPEAKADNVASNQEVAEAQTDDAEGAPKEETFKKSTPTSKRCWRVPRK